MFTTSLIFVKYGIITYFLVHSMMFIMSMVLVITLLQTTAFSLHLKCSIISPYHRAQCSHTHRSVTLSCFANHTETYFMENVSRNRMAQRI